MTRFPITEKTQLRTEKLKPHSFRIIDYRFRLLNYLDWLPAVTALEQLKKSIGRKTGLSQCYWLVNDQPVRPKFIDDGLSSDSKILRHILLAGRLNHSHRSSAHHFAPMTQLFLKHNELCDIENNLGLPGKILPFRPRIRATESAESSTVRSNRGVVLLNPSSLARLIRVGNFARQPPPLLSIRLCSIC